MQSQLELGSGPGSRRLLLLWNGAAANGHLAGTGAYVYMWNLTFFPADEQFPAAIIGQFRAAIEGVDMVLTQLKTALTNHGLKVISPEGLAFDGPGTLWIVTDGTARLLRLTVTR